MKRIILLILIAGLWLTSCHNENGKQHFQKSANYIAVFRVELNLGNDSFISAVAFKDNKAYYFKKDTLLLTYRSLPFKNAQVINDTTLIRQIRSLADVDFNAINVKACNCTAKSMGTIVVKKSEIDTTLFSMDKIGDCNTDPGCKSLNAIDSIFFKLDKQ